MSCRHGAEHIDVQPQEGCLVYQCRTCGEIVYVERPRLGMK